MASLSLHLYLFFSFLLLHLPCRVMYWQIFGICTILILTKGWLYDVLLYYKISSTCPHIQLRLLQELVFCAGIHPLVHIRWVGNTCVWNCKQKLASLKPSNEQFLKRTVERKLTISEYWQKCWTVPRDPMVPVPLSCLQWNVKDTICFIVHALLCVFTWLLPHCRDMHQSFRDACSELQLWRMLLTAALRNTSDLSWPKLEGWHLLH